MTTGIQELNLHGMTKLQARAAIDASIRRCGGGVYRLRLIHGYQRGTQLRDMIRQVYKKHPKVLRIELSLNPGQTDLVFREFI